MSHESQHVLANNITLCRSGNVMLASLEADKNEDCFFVQKVVATQTILIIIILRPN